MSSSDSSLWSPLGKCYSQDNHKYELSDSWTPCPSVIPIYTTFNNTTFNNSRLWPLYSFLGTSYSKNDFINELGHSRNLIIDTLEAINKTFYVFTLCGFFKGGSVFKKNWKMNSVNPENIEISYYDVTFIWWILSWPPVHYIHHNILKIFPSSLMFWEQIFWVSFLYFFRKTLLVRGFEVELQFFS